MSKVQKLPDSLVHLIAAGEVIERPASALKEILENSLDAGARHLRVVVRGAGRQLLQVVDDGEGMSPEDAQAALERHATSKLRNYTDLEKLSTFGFRGEALPSIAAISEMEILTRTKDAGEAWRIRLEGGKPVLSQPAAHPGGTTVQIENLFYNTPARLKFLKRDPTERQHIVRTVQEVALAHPGVAIDFFMDDKPVWQLPSHTSLLERTMDLWGPAWGKQVTVCRHQEKGLDINGLISQVPDHQSTKTTQYLFVNGRPIQHRMLTQALYEAYREWLPVGRHPMFVLFVQIDPSRVDVNVHPTKREVRFSEDRIVRDAIFYAVRQVLRQIHTANAVTGEIATNTISGLSQRAEPFTLSHRSGETYRQPAGTAQPSPAFAQPELAAVGFSSTSESAPTSALKAAPRFFSQFQRVYLVAEWENELLLVDQHAASERIWFEQLMTQAHAGGWNRQLLLAPHLWNVSPELAQRLPECDADLKRFGLMLEAFGHQTFVIKEMPSFLKSVADAQTLAETIVESSQELPTNDNPLWHKTVARAACRAAIMAGDTVTVPEMEKLWANLLTCERPQTCPHGRPTHIRLPLVEFHKRFKRI